MQRQNENSSQGAGEAIKENDSLLDHMVPCCITVLLSL